jgi:flagellar biosynthesis/type III secretory pathway chaperone
MNAFPQMLTDLRAHQVICRELLGLAERESQALRQSQNAALHEIYQTKKALLPRLNESLEKVRRHRIYWQGLSATERATQPEINFLVRQVQDLIMRVILLDRENEQGLLRRGLIPAREIPAAAVQRPNFVASLYRRQQAP